MTTNPEIPVDKRKAIIDRLTKAGISAETINEYLTLEELDELTEEEIESLGLRVTSTSTLDPKDVESVVETLIDDREKRHIDIDQAEE